MTPLTAHPRPGTLLDPLYPDSDGEPMGESDFHSYAVRMLVEALEDAVADREDVYVASNLILYYEQGNPSGRRDPDVMVARGVGKHRRRSFRLWEELVVPSPLFEVASEKTWQNDVEEKRILYARLGVGEYFVFDPEDRFLKRPLLGFRLVNGQSVAMTPAADGSLVSEELGLRLIVEGSMLRLIDLATGTPIPTRWERAKWVEAEAQRAAKQAEARIDVETKRAQEAERQAAELAAEVKRLQAVLKPDS